MSNQENNFFNNIFNFNSMCGGVDEGDGDGDGGGAVIVHGAAVSGAFLRFKIPISY